MAVSSRLALLQEMQREILRVQLVKYGIDVQTIQMASLPQGQDNLNLLFSYQGKRFVSRIYIYTLHRDVSFELELITRLTAAGFPTARVIPTQEGALFCDALGLPTAVFEFIEGHPLDKHRTDSLSKAASLLADLHQLTGGMEIAYPRTFSGFSRIVGLRLELQQHANLGVNKETQDFLSDLEEMSNGYLAQVQAAGKELRSGIIHHDVNPSNILSDKSGKIRALLDFDEAHSSQLIMDLAGLLHNWCVLEANLSLDLEATRTALQSYEEKILLSPSERDLLPDALLLYFALDAAEYLQRRLKAGKSLLDIRESHSLRLFLNLRSSSAWRNSLKGKPRRVNRNASSEPDEHFLGRRAHFQSQSKNRFR